MQTPVVSSFMGRESGGEQREWAQWGLLAGSACSQGRKEDREEEVVSQEERGEKGGRGEKDSTVQDGSGNPDCSQASITHGCCLAAVSLCRATCQTHPLPSSLSL